MPDRYFEMPKDWKGAGSGEEEIDWLLYDTEGGYDSANATLVYFDQAESSVGLDETNMPVAGQLPSSQRFLIKEIHFFINDVVASADAHNIMDRSYLELKINNKRMLAGPLRMFVGGGTVVNAAVTQDEDQITGEGFKLDKGIVINGGDNFVVETDSGETSMGTDAECAVVLRGRLVRPA